MARDVVEGLPVVYERGSYLVLKSGDGVSAERYIVGYVNKGSWMKVARYRTRFSAEMVCRTLGLCEEQEV